MFNRDVDTEKLLALTLIVIATYMYIEARSFQGNVSTFPQMTASVVVIGSFLVIIKNYLPTPIKKAVTDTSRLVDSNDEQIAELDEQRKESGTNKETDLKDDPAHLKYRQIITFVLLVAYVVGSYLIGFLFASPIFVTAYTLIMRQPWHVVAITSLIAFGIVYAFMIVLNIPVNDGLLVEAGSWL